MSGLLKGPTIHGFSDGWITFELLGARSVDAASIVHTPTGFIATPVLSSRLRPRRRMSLTCGTLRAHLA